MGKKEEQYHPLEEAVLLAAFRHRSLVEMRALASQSNTHTKARRRWAVDRSRIDSTELQIVLVPIAVVWHVGMDLYWTSQPRPI